MKEMKNGWKKLIIALLILPIVAFFPACGCSNEEGEPQLKPKDYTYTVHFYTDTDETFNIPNQYLKYGQLVVQPETPEKYGYSFVGWYTEPWVDSVDYKGRVWLFESDVVSQTMTLYARWQPLS